MPGASPITSYLVDARRRDGIAARSSGGDAVGTVVLAQPDRRGASRTARACRSRVASRNDFYAGRTDLEPDDGKRRAGRCADRDRRGPVATPALPPTARTATLSWGGVFADNGTRDHVVLRRRLRGRQRPTCTVTGVENGQPVLTRRRPAIRDFKPVTDDSRSTSPGSRPNHNYSFIVYAYNGQGCTAGAVVHGRPAARAGHPDGRADRPRRRPTTAPDCSTSRSTGVTYRAGGGTNGTVVNYWLTRRAASCESGQLGLGGGVLAPAGTRHYGVDLTLAGRRSATSTRAATRSAAATFTKPLGTPVSTQLTGARYDPTTRTFSWTGWPTGSYDYVRFSCDGGATRTDMPAVGQTPTCTVDADRDRSDAHRLRRCGRTRLRTQLEECRPWIVPSTAILMNGTPPMSSAPQTSTIERDPEHDDDAGTGHLVLRRVRAPRVERRPGAARQDAHHPARAHGPVQRGPPAARGLPGHGQDLAGARDRAERARHEQPHPVHARPAAGRHHRASTSTTSAPATSSSTADRCSPTSCSPTRSTGRARRRSPRCSR